MSIKNIIQQENDLQEMSTQSLANYLNNPTGQYNPYLVAGELQRKEAFAQRQAIEPPQGTVVDELVSQAMPMGGMPGPQPMPGPPMGGMPPPSQAGISSIPTPNMQPSFAAGGIVGYAGGEEVDYGDIAGDFAVDAGLMSMFGAPGFFMSPGTAEAATKYDDEEFAAMVNQDDTLAGAGVVGAGVVANEARKKANTKKAPTVKGKVPTVKGNKAGIAALIASKVPGASKLIDKATDYLRKVGTKPVAPKKLTKAERAKQSKIDKAAQKKKDNDTRTATQKIKDKAKELYNSTNPASGPLTRGTIAAAKGIGQGAGPLTRGVKTLATRYPVESIAGGLGINALINEGVLYGDTPEEVAAAEAEKVRAKAADDQAQLDLLENTRLKNQADLDAAQAKRDDAAKRRAYLALALGGAKTMAGQSPYALANIGEGMGTGVASLVELDEADAARQATMGIAEQKYMNDLYKQTISQMDTFNDLKLKLRGGEDQTFTQVFLGRLDDRGIDPSDVTNPEYIKIENETIIDLYPGTAPRGSTMVAGQPFIEA